MDENIDKEDETIGNEGALDGGMDVDDPSDKEMDSDADDTERVCPSCSHPHAAGVACDCGCV